MSTKRKVKIMFPLAVLLCLCLFCFGFAMLYPHSVKAETNTSVSFERVTDSYADATGNYLYTDFYFSEALLDNTSEGMIKDPNAEVWTKSMNDEWGNYVYLNGKTVNEIREGALGVGGWPAEDPNSVQLTYIYNIDGENASSPNTFLRLTVHRNAPAGWGFNFGQGHPYTGAPTGGWASNNLGGNKIVIDGDLPLSGGRALKGDYKFTYYINEWFVEGDPSLDRPALPTDISVSVGTADTNDGTMFTFKFGSDGKNYVSDLTGTYTNALAYTGWQTGNFEGGHMGSATQEDINRFISNGGREAFYDKIEIETTFPARNGGQLTEFIPLGMLITRINIEAAGNTDDLGTAIRVNLGQNAAGEAANDSFTLRLSSASSFNIPVDQFTSFKFKAGFKTLSGYELKEDVIVSVGENDRTALQEKIAEGDTKQEADYTPSTWAVFADALADAKALNEKTPQSIVNSAYETLDAAITALEPAAVEPISSIQLTSQGELSQKLGALTNVTVTATVNSGADVSLVEWYVNDVKQDTTGAIFSFTPSALGTHTITAKSGDVVRSNSISVTVSYADVDTVLIQAEDFDLLEQVLGSLSPVTFIASVNENADVSLVEWYVDDVKQDATGAEFTFTPSEAGAYEITAKVGRYTSTSLTVNVSYAAVTSITVTSQGSLEQKEGALSAVTFTAAVNENADAATVEWYVNDEKQGTGATFAFTPAAEGTYVVTAKVGTVASNSVTVTVTAAASDNTGGSDNTGDNGGCSGVTVGTAALAGLLLVGLAAISFAKKRS